MYIICSNHSEENPNALYGLTSQGSWSHLPGWLHWSSTSTSNTETNFHLRAFAYAAPYARNAFLNINGLLPHLDSGFIPLFTCYLQPLPSSSSEHLSLEILHILLLLILNNCECHMGQSFVFFTGIPPAPKMGPGSEKGLKDSLNECEA